MFAPLTRPFCDRIFLMLRHVPTSLAVQLRTMTRFAVSALLVVGASAARCSVGMYDHADFGCTSCPAGKFAENMGSTDVREHHSDALHNTTTLSTPPGRVTCVYGFREKLRVSGEHTQSHMHAGTLVTLTDRRETTNMKQVHRRPHVFR